MTKKEKSPGQAPPSHTYRGGAFFIVTTALIIALFTGGIAYGVQAIIGGSGEPAEGVSVNGTVKEFVISVEEWSYEPAVIKVNPGDVVKFTVTSMDVWHGFAINELGINLAIPGGETVTSEVVIPADIDDGMYTMYCSVFCGLGHPYLKGKVIVGNPRLFLGVGMGRALPYIATMAMAVIFATVVVIGGRRTR